MPAAPLKSARIDEGQFAAWHRVVARLVAAQGAQVTMRDALAAMLELASAATDDELTGAMRAYYAREGDSGNG